MADYRAFKVSTVSGSVALGKGTDYPNVWGVMRGEGNPSGSVSLAGGGVINLVSIDNHQIFPCYPTYLTISSGAMMILE
jgi:hypothetical protein